jgi:hypothetical protein
LAKACAGAAHARRYAHFQPVIISFLFITCSTFVGVLDEFGQVRPCLGKLEDFFMNQQIVNLAEDTVSIHIG